MKEDGTVDPTAMTSENQPTAEVPAPPVDLRLRSWFSFGFEPGKRSCNRRVTQGEGGQIIVEYVLLLAVAVMMAAIITRMMVSPDRGSPGFVLKTWNEIVTAIGADTADDIDRN